MKRYIISLRDPAKNVGGPKANMDNIHNLEKLGFSNYWLDYGWNFWDNHGIKNAIKSRVNKFKMAYLTLPRFFKQHSDMEYLILQYPLYSAYTMKRIVECMRKYTKAKLYIIIHDVESIRLYINEPEKGAAEIESFNLADGIIGHNQKMNTWLKENGVNVPLIDLGIFDYNNPQPLQKYTSYSKTLCYAGNLIDAKFLDEYHQKSKLTVFGPNPAEKYNDSIEYKGQYTPEELPKHLTQNFGLVWHGTSADTCNGTFGKYLRYNNPHKTSLYLSSGLPVIIWDQAALADFVKENGVGITISNLNDLDEKLNSITEEEYHQMHDNVEKIAKKMRSGYYVTTAVNKLING